MPRCANRRRATIRFKYPWTGWDSFIVERNLPIDYSFETIPAQNIPWQCPVPYIVDFGYHIFASSLCSAASTTAINRRIVRTGPIAFSSPTPQCYSTNNRFQVRLTSASHGTESFTTGWGIYAHPALATWSNHVRVTITRQDGGVDNCGLIPSSCIFKITDSLNATLYQRQESVCPEVVVECRACPDELCECERANVICCYDTSTGISLISFPK